MTKRQLKLSGLSGLIALEATMLRHARFGLSILVGLIVSSVAAAQTTPTPGTWELYPPQEAVYTTAVQQPINLDGTSNFKNSGKSVIPIKFSLSKTPGPVVFQSIGSNGATADDFSFLSFTPDDPPSFADIASLIAEYQFTEGNCHGGSLRWSVRFSPTESVNIYYGAEPNTTNCTNSLDPAINQSGVNMIDLTDLRYDTSQIAGGTWYDDYIGALVLVGARNVVKASLVLDSGWGGDQIVELGNVSVNGNTFVPQSGNIPTCDLPPATIQITKTGGAPSGPVNEPVSVQPNDNDSNFRIVDCKYMYNLATSSLSGVGRYKVEAVIGGTPAAGAANFDLR